MSGRMVGLTHLGLVVARAYHLLSREMAPETDEELIAFLVSKGNEEKKVRDALAEAIASGQVRLDGHRVIFVRLIGAGHLS